MEIHELDRKTVSSAIAQQTIGTYRLGDFTPDGGFRPRYIGRSTTCLQNRLLDHASRARYSAFQYQRWDSVRETYEVECLWFHSMRDRLDNTRHPDAPRSLPYTCKYCARHSLRLVSTASPIGGGF